MRTVLSALALLLSATLTHATCSGPDVFQALPQETQTDLRARAAKVPFHTGILWQVEKDGVTSTLVGTFHIAHPMHAHTVARLADISPAPEQVLLELTTPAQTAFQRYLMDNPDIYLIEEGDSLIDLLGDSHWAMVSEQLKDRGIPPFLAARYQPWFLGLTIAMPACAMADIAAGKPGLDLQIEALANDQSLPTDSLDSTEGLLAILAADPIDDQVADLRDSLEMGLLEGSTEQMPAMIALYEAQEIQLIWELGRHLSLSAAPASAADEIAQLLTEVEDQLIEARNRQWADRLIPELATTSSLVAVGALHMPGEQGLLRLLEKAGYTVTRLPLH